MKATRRIIASIAIGGAALLGLAVSSSQSSAMPAPRWYCSTTTTQGEPCIPDPTTTVKPTTTTHYATTTAKPTTTTATTLATTTTATTIATTTTASTIATTTTAKPTTTTVTVPNCGLCAGQSGTTTTVPQTTTTVAQTTTTAPAATTVATTAPAETTTVQPSATTSVGQKMPETGSSRTMFELAVAFGLIFAGWAALAFRAAVRKP